MGELVILERQQLAAFAMIEVNPTFLNVFTMHGTFHGFSVVAYINYMFHNNLISLFIIEWE